MKKHLIKLFKVWVIGLVKEGFVERAIEDLRRYLDEIRFEREERIRHLEEKLKGLEKLKEIKEKRLNGDLSWSDIEEAQKVTCWGNLAYCCSPKKGCPYSFAVMDALGLNPKEFSKFKEKAVNEYIREKLRIAVGST